MPKNHHRRIACPVIIPIGPSIAYVPLTQGKFSLISASAVSLVDNLFWTARDQYEGKFYAARSAINPQTGKRGAVYLHRVIADAPAGMHVDHINGNPLDNRDENLRLVTMSQNMRNRKMTSKNTTGYKGVCLDWYTKKWKASVGHDGKVINLGSYDSPEEAYAKACEGRIKYHGEFATH